MYIYYCVLLLMFESIVAQSYLGADVYLLLFCVFIYDLLTQVGSKVVNVFLGAVIYVFTVGLLL